MEKSGIARKTTVAYPELRFIKNTIKKLTSPRNKNTIKNKAKILETNINETQMSWHKAYSRP